MTPNIFEQQEQASGLKTVIRFNQSAERVYWLVDVYVNACQRDEAFLRRVVAQWLEPIVQKQEDSRQW